MKQTPIRKVSKRMARQRRLERALIQRLLVRCKGLCERCGQWPDFRGLGKHEELSRARGGDPLDPENCEMRCGRCHSEAHGIRELDNH